MTVINSLGVNALSIRGAGTDYHRLSRVYESLSEANSDSGFSATAGVEHVALIKGIGLAFYNHSSSQWEHTATELETNVDDLISLAGVAENSANLGTFTGSTISDNQTIKQALQALETTLEAIDLDTDDMAALTGLAENVTNLGTFSGSTISDSSTVKAALQALETSLETMSPSATVTEIDGNVDDLISLTGIAENTTNLGTFSGSTIADSVTVKAALQALETALELKAASSTVTEVDGNVDDVISVLGVAENVTHLGTFSGSTISDSQTIKQALQALETALELKAASSTVTEIDGNVNDLLTLTGITENTDNLGAFTGSIIADNVNIKVALQTLETLLEDTDGNTDSLIALTGISENVSHLGTFSGSTIADSTTIKAALQALESSVELKATIDDPTFTTKISSPAFHASGSGHLVLKAMTGNDLNVFLAGAETLQVTRSGTDCRFTSNGGSGTFKFNQETDLAGGMKLAGTAITATATELNYVDGVTSAIQTQLDTKATTTAVALKADIASPTFTGTPAAPTAAAATNTTQIATTAFVTTAIANLSDSAPGTLDTLNELAAALGDDANFSTTVTNLINANETHIDNMATLTGAAKDAVNLGTFTGSTISDNQTIKASLQALETSLELKAPLAAPSLTGTVDIGGEGTLKKDGDDFEIDLSGTTGILKLGTRLVSSHTMLVGTVGFETKLQGTIALNNASSEFKIQNSNRIYVENTDIVLDNGGVVKISDNNASALTIGEASNAYMTFDTTNSSERVHAKKDLVQNPAASVTPANNGELMVEATNNTTLTFKLKGSDGTVRSGTITLS